jgi:hypothetical protein
MDGFAAKNDHHAGETSQRDRDLRSNTKSFAGFPLFTVLFVLYKTARARLLSFCTGTDSHYFF